MASRAALPLPALLLAAAGQLPGAAAKGYYNTGYGSTYYQTPTTYYTTDIHGHQHEYGTRDWNSCAHNCDQTVYVDQATWMLTAQSGAFDCGDSPDDVRAAVASRWSGLDDDLVWVNCQR